MLLLHIGSVATLESGENNPRVLAKIYQFSRKLCTELDLYGVIQFTTGYYLQIIEGGKNEVKYFNKCFQQQGICRQLAIILRIDSSKSYFNSSPMRVVHILEKDIYYRRFKATEIHHFEKIEQSQKQLLQLFSESSNEITTLNKQVLTAKLNQPVTSKKLLQTERRDEVFKNKVFHLIQWPDFTKVKQSPFVIELCARLTTMPTSHQNLLTQIKLGDAKLLNRTLHQLNELKILQIEVDTSKTNCITKSVNNNREHSATSKSFLRRLQQLISFEKLK